MSLHAAGNIQLRVPHRPTDYKSVEDFNICSCSDGCIEEDGTNYVPPGHATPLPRVAKIRRSTDTFLFISHTTNVLLFKFRCNIFVGVRIVKEMPGSVASGTYCICQ